MTASSLTAPAAADLFDRLSSQGVRYLFGAYVDIHGVPKSKCVPLSHLSTMAEGSEQYTVGALDGMGELGPHEAECKGIPDLDALTVLPWSTQYALAPADLLFDGKPYSHDSRHVLKRQMAVAAEQGYAVNTGIEPEIYVLREVDGTLRPLVEADGFNDPTRGYDIETLMLAESFTDPMMRYMQQLGWEPYSFVHEGGDGQFEFEFAYCDAVGMADRMVIFRLLAKHVARELGAFATCMPKPFSDGFGSGAHLNISLAGLTDGENRFDGPNGLTDCARQFTAGVLRHAGAIAAVVCPTVNSYKRLLPRGLMNEISWAPVFRAYGDNNRTLMCRLPENRACLELRICDMSANFYLATAMTLAAGLEGVRLGLDPGPPVNVDTYSLSQAERDVAGLQLLPQTLGEAIDEFAADELAQDVFGPEFHATFAAAKREEWRAYNTVVSEWERERYLRLW